MRSLTRAHRAQALYPAALGYAWLLTGDGTSAQRLAARGVEQILGAARAPRGGVAVAATAAAVTAERAKELRSAVHPGGAPSQYVLTEAESRLPAPDRLRRALAVLSPRHRFVMVAFFIEGLGAGEIGEMLGLTPPAVTEALEQSARAIAPAVGVLDLPDFGGAVRAIDVTAQGGPR